MPLVEKCVTVDGGAIKEPKNVIVPIGTSIKDLIDFAGGFKEELQEITWSLGAEYAYNQQFFARMGYYYENANKGGRSYFGFGAGFSLNVVRLDASYLLATSQHSPPDQTLRFTLSFDLHGLRDLQASQVAESRPFRAVCFPLQLASASSRRIQIKLNATNTHRIRHRRTPFQAGAQAPALRR
mgnify:CR=1 FL=1